MHDDESVPDGPWNSYVQTLNLYFKKIPRGLKDDLTLKCLCSVLNQ